METCYIFGAGDFTPCTIDLTSKDLVIAADGGYDYLIRLGLRADVVLGDFDSVTSPDLWDDAICEKLTYPPEKDDTDMMLAIKLGLSRGYREFAIYGGLGGRLDHTIANIQSLSYLAGEGATGILYGDSYALTVIKASSFTVPKDATGMVSVFSQRNCTAPRPKIRRGRSYANQCISTRSKQRSNCQKRNYQCGIRYFVDLMASVRY